MDLDISDVKAKRTLKTTSGKALEVDGNEK
jgi:hypothetical protein